MRRRVPIKQAMATLVLAALTGCDGGGDDRLMPEAPKLGAVLQQDAAVLRPFQPGTKWTYNAESSASPTAWRVDVSQWAFEGGVEETARGSDGSISYHPLAYRHGDVVQFNGCELIGGMTTCDEWIELRSPVRVGDQIELVNRDDYGDAFVFQGRPSRIEYVVYRRVVGEELVSLPELGSSISAVRVDTFMKQRVTDTGGEGQQWRFEATSSTWYAPGIGVVRRHFDVPASMFGPQRTGDQRLVAWVPASPAPNATTAQR